MDGTKPRTARSATSSARPPQTNRAVMSPRHREPSAPTAGNGNDPIEIDSGGEWCSRLIAAVDLEHALAGGSERLVVVYPDHSTRRVVELDPQRSWHGCG